MSSKDNPNSPKLASAEEMLKAISFSGKGHQALVVDDDPEFRANTQKVLEDNGFVVHCLESGHHVMRFIQNQPWSWAPSLLITDIVMDGMGGYLLMKQFQELYPNRDIPMIVVSRLMAAVDLGEAEVAGASAYFCKPVDPDKLLKTIETLLTTQQRTMLIFRHDLSSTLQSR